MKKDNLAPTIKFLVCFDDVTNEQIEQCRLVGVKLYTYEQVRKVGAEQNGPEF